MPNEMFGSRHHGYLGTVIEFQIHAATNSVADEVELLMLNELARLHDLFNVYDPESAVGLWRHGNAGIDPEVRLVWTLAEAWLARTGGAFSPTAGVIRGLWETAAEEDRPPNRDELHHAVQAAQRPFLAEGDQSAARSALDLNAIAKGWIVDRVTDIGLGSGLADGLTVNAGGDLLHRSSTPIVVGIEDPARPYDNVPPLNRVTLSGGALATSGGARRYRTVAGERYSHVVDPRSGEPVAHVAQASVIASTATDADVIATALMVMRADERTDFVESLGDVAVLVVDGDATVHKHGRWSDLEVS